MTVNENGTYSLLSDVAPVTMIAMEYRLVEGMHPDAGTWFEALFCGFMAQAGADAEVLLERSGDGSALTAKVCAIATDEEGDYCPCDVEEELALVALDILQSI